jgi:hypothetical protein
MKTNHEHTAQRGNALIYVLIAIALFAGLSFILSRQGDNSETSSLAGEKAEMYATQLISFTAQTRQVIEQMMFSGSQIDDLDFMPPTDAAFETPPNIHKVYHPQGGGLSLKPLPPEVIAQSSASPPAGWYLGRFNNVEWTATAGTDVILAAYQISQPVCAALNQKINGSSAIPSVTVALKLILIDDSTAAYGAGVNTDLTTDAMDICPDCDHVSALCVEQGGMYAFYTLIVDR